MPGILREYSSFFDFLFRLIDPSIIVAVYLIVHYFFPGLCRHDLIWVLTIYSSGLVVFIFPFFQLYRSWRGIAISTEMFVLARAWLVVLLIFNVMIFVLADEGQREVLWPYGLLKVQAFWLWAGFCFAGMAVSRVIIRYGLRSLRYSGRNTRTVAVLGAGDLGKNVLEKIRQNPWLGYRVQAFFDDNPTKIGTEVSGVPVLADLDDGVEYTKEKRIDVVFIALPMRNESRIREMIQGLNDTTADVFLIPDIFNFHILNLSLMEIAGMPLINLHAVPIKSYSNQVLKWMEDKILASLILALISPLMVFIALRIKMTSPGPVLFKQRRYGLNGDSIVVYKFRSMTVCEDGADVLQAKKCDPRVTTFGAFLRRTSLDELPQFINVLQGRMSIVGPRPHAVAHNELYRKLIDSYMLRHKVKPGITGWAQVNGFRGETDTLEKMEKRVEYDLYYITNWSLWFDIRIIFKTIFKGFVGENAY